MISPDVATDVIKSITDRGKIGGFMPTFFHGVATDVIKSITDRGKIGGFMPTFFHGDHASTFVTGSYLRGIRDFHASTFVTGSYLRGIRDFDVQAAYELLLNNAFVEGSGKGPMGGETFH